MQKWLFPEPLGQSSFEMGCVGLLRVAPDVFLTQFLFHQSREIEILVHSAAMNKGFSNTLTRSDHGNKRRNAGSGCNEPGLFIVATEIAERCGYENAVAGF